MESVHDPATDFGETISVAISRALHKTAQPLTILQGLLDFMLVRIATHDPTGKPGACAGAKAPLLVSCHDCKCLLQRASEEVPRLAGCFEEIRELIELQKSAGDVDSVPLTPLVTDLLRNLSGDLHAADVTVVFDERPSDDPMGVLVHASMSRVSALIRLVLTTLVNCLRAGDQIRIAIETNGANAEIKLRPSRHFSTGERDALLGTLTSQLHFAQLLSATVGGELRHSKMPDIVVLSLPKIPARPTAQDRQRMAMYV